MSFSARENFYIKIQFIGNMALLKTITESVLNKREFAMSVDMWGTLIKRANMPHHTHLDRPLYPEFLSFT